MSRTRTRFGFSRGRWKRSPRMTGTSSSFRAYSNPKRIFSAICSR